MKRPSGVTAVAAFFLVGSVVVATTFVALLLPGGLLEPIWRLNPLARESFKNLGGEAPVLMLSVAVACFAASVGLMRRRLGGWRIAIGLLRAPALPDR